MTIAVQTESATSTLAHKIANATGILREWEKVFTLAATDCCCCGQPLRDAVSVQRGIGPICSAQHYDLDIEITPEMMQIALGILHSLDLPIEVKLGMLGLKEHPRDMCNLAIWWASTHLDNRNLCIELGRLVTALGFVSLGDRIVERNTNVLITKTDDGYIVRARARGKLVAEMKRVPAFTIVPREGRFKYGWKFPTTHKPLVWAILGSIFGGEWVTVPGSEGPAVERLPVFTELDVRREYERLYPRPTLRARAQSGTATQIVRVQPDSRWLEVHTPSKSAAFVERVKMIPSRERSWNPARRCWLIDRKHETRLRDLVAQCYNGMT